jgi:hypothetical protein
MSAEQILVIIPLTGENGGVVAVLTPARERGGDHDFAGIAARPPRWPPLMP